MNMKTTLLLTLFAAVMGLTLWLVKPWETPAETPEEPPKSTAKDLFAAADKPVKENIDRVELVTRDLDAVFTKKGNDWTLVKPVQAPAAEYEVTSLIDAVRDLKYLKAYDQSSAERPSDDVSGISKPTANVKLMTGDKVVAEMTVGSRLPTGRGHFVKLAGGDTIYESQNDLTYTFNKKLENLRNRQVIKFDMANVQKVRLEGAANVELVKSGDKYVLESPVRGRADKERAEKLIRPMSSLYIQEWKDDEPITLKSYGLDKPKMKLVVQTQETVPAKAKPGDPNTQPADTQPSTETREHVLLIGDATDIGGKSYFAKLGSAPWVFSLSESNVKDMMPTLTELMDKDIAELGGVDKVQKVAVETAEGNITFTKENGRWTGTGGQQVDNAAVEDLVKAVEDLKATDFANPKDALIAPNWDKPRARVTLTIQGKPEPLTVLVGDMTASGRMAYVKSPGQETVALVREEEVAQLVAPPVAYQDRMVLRFARELANKIQIEQTGKPTVVLNNEKSHWSMVEPVQVRADADAVRNLLQDVSMLRAKRIVGADKSKFGLDKPDVKLTVWVQPPPPPVSTQPAATQPAATQPATPQASAVTPLTAQLAMLALTGAETQPAAKAPAATQPVGRKPTLEELLEYQKTLPNANPLATQMLEEMIAKEKAEKAKATQPAAVGETPATQPAVSITPVTQPAAVVAAPATQPVAGPQSYTLLLVERDGVTYAAVEGSSTVYEIEHKVFDDITAEMHDRQVTNFDTGNVVEVGFFGADGSELVLRKSGEDWKYAADPALPIDNQKVNDVLGAVHDLRTHRYVTYNNDNLARYGLEEKFQKLVVRLQNGTVVEVLLSLQGPNDADEEGSRYARLADGRGVFLLKKDQAVKFNQKLEDFEKGGSTAAAAPSHVH